MVADSSPVAVTSVSDFAAASNKEFLDIQATIECGFTLKRVRGMTRTYSQLIRLLSLIVEKGMGIFSKSFIRVAWFGRAGDNVLWF